jgi:hypothetical protein
MWFPVTVRSLLISLQAALLALALAACGRARVSERRAGPGVVPARHRQSVAARLVALRMEHVQARRILRDHRYEARHAVRVTLDGRPDQAFEDRYELRCAGPSDCYGRQDNSLEYGLEFYRIGELTYFRHRYQRYLRFAEEPAEARLRVERIWGAGAAVIELLQGHLALTPAGETTAAGRPASRYKLAPGQGVPRVHHGRRAWRSRLKVISVSGEALLDKATGVPLSLRVSYAVAAPKAGRTVTLTGTFEGAVREAGKPLVLRPPVDFRVARARPRDSQDLHLLGSHRLNPGWFRGGGPQAAHRAHRGGGAAPAMAPTGASAMPPARRPRPAPITRRAPVMGPAPAGKP